MEFRRTTRAGHEHRRGLRRCTQQERSTRRAEKKRSSSQPISRVLSWTAIHLGRTSPCASCGLPGSDAGNIIGSLFGLAPSGVYRATPCYHACGALLPHPFTLTARRIGVGGLLSAALSVGSRPPGVTWHSALWSPDFPPARPRGDRASGCLAGSNTEHKTTARENLSRFSRRRYLSRHRPVRPVPGHGHTLPTFSCL